jgi:hypothetical protein
MDECIECKESKRYETEPCQSCRYAAHAAIIDGETPQADCVVFLIYGNVFANSSIDEEGR